MKVHALDIIYRCNSCGSEGVEGIEIDTHAVRSTIIVCHDCAKRMAEEIISLFARMQQA